jgi:hypothetical protein
VEKVRAAGAELQRAETALAGPDSHNLIEPADDNLNRPAGAPLAELVQNLPRRIHGAIVGDRHFDLKLRNEMVFGRLPSRPLVIRDFRRGVRRDQVIEALAEKQLSHLLQGIRWYVRFNQFHKMPSNGAADALVTQRSAASVPPEMLDIS